MLTRSKTSKLQAQYEHIMITDKPKQAVKKKSNRTVQLTEDLLYIVNKKLRKMDKATRDEKIQFREPDPLMEPIIVPFTEIAYRKRNYPGLLETELAVMHMINFDSNSTAVCKLNSMDQFLNSIKRGQSEAESPDFREFLSYKDRDAGDPVINPPARFIQLPKDYYRPHWDCPFFGELAWKENGVMIVEADKFALFLTIWNLKEWLVNPVSNMYPLSCGWAVGLWGPIKPGLLDCRCRNLLRAMWTDDHLRNIIKDKAFFERIDDRVDEDRMEAVLRANYAQLWRAWKKMEEYAVKLITGEEMISRSSRPLNVLAASQMLRMLAKFSKVLSCNHCIYITK